MRLGMVAGLVALSMGMSGGALALGAGQAEETYEYRSFACGAWGEEGESAEDGRFAGASVCVDVYEDAAGSPAYVVFAGRGSCVYDESSTSCEDNSVGGQVPASDVVFDAERGVVTIATRLRDCTINVAMAMHAGASDDSSYFSPGAEMREDQLRAYYQRDEHMTVKSGTATGTVCGWSEVEGEGGAFLMEGSETDRYLFVDTALPV